MKALACAVLVAVGSLAVVACGGGGGGGGGGGTTASNGALAGFCPMFCVWSG